MEVFKNYETEILGKSRKKVKVGDVFVVKLKDYDLYFYGKVICDDVKYCNMNDAKLVFIYKTPTKGIEIPDDMDETDIMIPIITGRSGWNEGYFKTICNIPVKDTEINADYGFYSLEHGGRIGVSDVDRYASNHKLHHCKDGVILAMAYIDCYGNVLDHIPAIADTDFVFSLATAPEARISAYLWNNSEVKRKYGIV